MGNITKFVDRVSHHHNLENETGSAGIYWGPAVYWALSSRFVCMIHLTLPWMLGSLFLISVFQMIRLWLFQIAHHLNFFFLFCCAVQQRGLSSLTRDWTPGPVQWKLEVLATGLPGRSPGCTSFKSQSWNLHSGLPETKDYVLKLCHVASP